MSVHVALLRGINVGRAKRIAMGELREVFEGLGHRDVRTLLNSGNVVFTPGRAGARGGAALAAALEKAIQRELQVTSRVTVLSAEELAGAVRDNPLAEADRDPSRFQVAFLRDPADREKLVPLASRRWSPEKLAMGAGVAYLSCPGGMAESPVGEAVFKALGDGVTARNWATVLKLHARASPAGEGRGGGKGRKS
jgi:uncharacterized protein (DUF1697 family)